jgi:hypothetical protein
VTAFSIAVTVAGLVEMCLYEPYSKVGVGDCWCRTFGFRTVWNREICYLFKGKIYSTIILPVVLYGCETWSLTLTDDLRLWVLENRMLRGIFGCI